jgi:hypothetical protein
MSVPSPPRPKESDRVDALDIADRSGNVPAVFTADQRLKFRLLADGVRIDTRAESAWLERFGGPITLGEYATTSGVTLELPGELHVNAPIASDAATPAELRFEDDTFFVASPGRTTPVTVLPVPAYHAREQPDRLTGAGQPFTNYGVTHTDRVRVSPISGCAWRCEFCDLPYEFTYRKRHEANLLEVIRAAVDDPLLPARHVLVSGGTPRAPIPARPGRPGSDDEAWLDGVFAYLADHSPIPVDVMMPPRRDLDHPAWLRSVGINAVSINLEVSDPHRAREIAPAKAKLGREYSLRYVERAVRAFGVGQVQSLLVFGAAIEPLESTLRGVRDLAVRGCSPVLSAFRPHHLTPLAGAPAATYEEMLEAFERSVEICVEAGTGVLPGPRCIACQHNTVTVPLESDFYVGPDGDLTAPPACPVS